MRIDTALGDIRAHGAINPGADVIIGIRPELIRKEASENTVTLPLAEMMVLGAKTHLYGATSGDDRFLCELPGIHNDADRGQDVTFGWSVADTLIYEAAP